MSKKLFEKCYNFTRADEIKQAGVYPYFNPIEESEGPVVNMNGKKIIMAGSNNYLGLTSHPKVKEAAIAALDKYGTSCSGSRYLTGTIDLHNELEIKLAKFVNKESALLFSTGYQAGQGVISPLVGRHDFIFSDKDNHASIQTANMLAKGIMGTEVLRYHHNDMTDLENKLNQVKDKNGAKFIVTDGVFSAFGDMPDLITGPQATDEELRAETDGKIVEDGVLQEDLDPEVRAMVEDKSQWFIHKNFWQRSLIVFAGPLFNFILAYLIAVGIALGIGLMDVDGTKLGSVLAGSPADKAGLKQGDIVLAVSDQSVSDFSQIQKIVNASEGKELSFKIDRAGEILTFSAMPQKKTIEVPGSGKIENYMIGITVG
ncbi:MAG: aminotransferase class I/II-fold pyridoxal phosphate-dependent enzyme, partial [Chitinophagales bacterium]|nr:aminotransferase class I/II-fold pyridoxal phosphate-dependent enzyme [Chitinophagales bacterium]